MTRDESSSRLAIKDAAYRHGHSTALADLRAEVQALLAPETAPGQPVEQSWNFAILSVLALIDRAAR